MKIVLAGGSGFIGKKLTDLLITKGHEVVILTRKKLVPMYNETYVTWLKEGAKPEEELDNVDVFINLAGVSINAGRWSHHHQKQIYESRMKATTELLRIIKVLKYKPSTLINASAIGIYPSSLDTTYTEDSQATANDFLGKTVRDWEATAKRAETIGVRTVFMRFGVILGNEGGALPLMTMPYEFFIGGTVGTGKQWVSWVHVTDVVQAILFAIENDHLNGPINVTAPTPIRMRDFGKTVAHVLKRPHWIPVPSFAMKLVLGQKSKLVLEGQRVVPKVLIEEKFDFQFPTLHKALEDLLK
ncbi:uncharacterized protein (TIGR01777 family) [Lysinibacillus composti]|uniref:TIGR01777 family protein n=1 Tax=Lysinibacillus composti TaxID=720633 RepID=A0A3N9USF4_9BACI|nr:TIGR01777 family oxidoreductase [Lysinibacillus composti]MBM7608527.1 uncharacterized protein (TIGR01777 family) [Lysinibacillus composti]RQW74816.1 TIGR01777 family protein [Lysinibacillus composti]